MTNKIERKYFIWGAIPSVYRELFEMINTYGIEKITLPIFVSLFESNSLSRTILNQVCIRTKK